MHTMTLYRPLWTHIIVVDYQQRVDLLWNSLLFFSYFFIVIFWENLLFIFVVLERYSPYLLYPLPSVVIPLPHTLDWVFHNPNCVHLIGRKWNISANLRSANLRRQCRKLFDCFNLIETARALWMLSKQLNAANRSRSIYQYSNMAPRLSGQTSLFGVVFFVSKSLLGIAGQKKLEKFAILTLKPRSHARIMIHRTGPISNT